MEAGGNFHGEKKKKKKEGRKGKKKSVTLQNCNVRSLVSMLIPIYVLLNAEKFHSDNEKVRRACRANTVSSTAKTSIASVLTESFRNVSTPIRVDRLIFPQWCNNVATNPFTNRNAWRTHAGRKAYRECSSSIEFKRDNKVQSSRDEKESGSE